MVGLDIHTSAHTVGEALGLFEYLLEHKVRISSFLYLSEIDIDGLHRQFLLLTEDADNLQFLPTTDHSDITILKIHDLVGILHDGTGVRAQEELIVADADHQGTLFTSRNNLIWIALVEHSNGIGTDHLIECHLNSRQEVELLMLLDVFNELYEHLRISVRNKSNALCLELLLQLCIILDDTIVNDSQVMAL